MVDTNICELALLAVVDAGNLNLSLGDVVILVDVGVEEQFLCIADREFRFVSF